MAVLPTVKVFGLTQERFGILLIAVIQVVLVVLFGVFVQYDEGEKPGYAVDAHIQKVYPMFMDVQVMILVGFGFLMTYLKRYAFGSLGFTYLIATILIQWSILSDGFYNMVDYKISINVMSLLKADVAAAAALISMGAILGRATYIQYIVMGVIEIAVYSANNYLATTVWKVSDAGASIFVHTFGAYFGLAVSYIVNRNKQDHPEVEFESTYTSDTFAMVGTIFLWIFWPSFNAAELTGDSQQRAIINTFISLAACVVMTFIMSWIIGGESKFNMVHIQNSSLAGGVAVGCAADLMIQPYGAMIVGMAAATISVFGYSILTPLIEKNFKIPDTCGVHNLHGMPGVFAALVGALMASVASTDMYKKTLYEHYPAMAPVNGTVVPGVGILSGDGRSAGMQAGYQLLALVATMGIAILGGLVTGFILRIKLWEAPKELEKHKDDHFWIIPAEQ